MIPQSWRWSWLEVQPGVRFFFPTQSPHQTCQTQVICPQVEGPHGWATCARWTGRERRNPACHKLSFSPSSLPLPSPLWSLGVWAVSSLLIPPRGCEGGGIACGRFRIVTGGLAAAPCKCTCQGDVCMISEWGKGGMTGQSAGAPAIWSHTPHVEDIGRATPPPWRRPATLPHRILCGWVDGGWKPYPQDKH